jgi:hypothetical protein
MIASSAPDRFLGKKSIEHDDTSEFEHALHSSRAKIGKVECLLTDTLACPN